jgi:transcriptional regulator of acetoin/glycerol metabolism
VIAVKATVVAGFLRQGQFFTREQAAQLMQQLYDLPRLLSSPQEEGRLMAVWERFLTEHQLPATLRPVVQDSWRRCKTLQLDPTLKQAPLETDAVQIEQRRLGHSDLQKTVRSLLQQTGERLGASNHLILFADPSGLILDVAGDRRTLHKAHEINLIVGGIWHEAVVGTNAIGTALVTRQPVQLYGGEHFCEGIKGWTCTAAVIHDPHDGQPLGVINISGLTDSFRQQSLDCVVAAAGYLEANLRQAYFTTRRRVLAASAALFIQWRGEGLLALDDRGCLIRVNALANAALKERAVHLPLTPQTRLPGLDLTLAAQESAAVQPGWLHTQWLQPIRHGNTRIGTLIILPKR